MLDNMYVDKLYQKLWVKYDTMDNIYVDKFLSKSVTELLYYKDYMWDNPGVSDSLNWLFSMLWVLRTIHGWSWYLGHSRLTVCSKDHPLIILGLTTAVGIPEL